MEFKIKNLKNNQSGVVLIMSLMILLVMVISVVALSRVVVGEVKMTRNSDNSIIAFYAAESGVERALYYLKSGRQTADFSAFNNLENDEVFIDNERHFSFVQATTSSAYFEAFDISTSSPATAQIVLPSGAIPGGVAVPGLSGSYIVKWSIDECLAGGHASDLLEISATSLYKEGGVLKSNTQQSVHVCGCDNSLDDACDIISSSDIDNDKFYYFSFRPLDSTVANLQFGPEFAYPGEANIEVSGFYRQSVHTINATAKTNLPPDDIFSYVIFSDDELSKNFP